ncbi:excalibur calcium-binding domain-containing protein [Ferrimonas balearica]|uniref:excalibur calcium-binding domain-containing protein n=1 Tax=Ferrimonas balearica TaxID=44012 RepID=UPI001C99E709|nr:excalibur calcium-binding domain-containing protein [Ferrimonas balearica]MBY5992396.1 excalibur calcium-binding domain-containing protein [Ferrimonas balearica]
MNKLFVLALCVAGLLFYANQHPNSNEPLAAPHSTSEHREPTVSNRFRCDGRQYCSQMTSREEAVFFTRHCPDTKMDGDGDGIPCENDSRW